MPQWFNAHVPSGIVYFSDFWSALYHHFALLAGTLLLYSMVGGQAKKPRAPLNMIGVGFFFGCAAVIAILHPFAFASSLSANLVYTMLMLSAAFGGPVSAVVAVLVVCGYKLATNGAYADADIATTAIVGFAIVATSYVRRSAERPLAFSELLRFCIFASLASLLSALMLRGPGIAINEGLAESLLNTAAILAIGFVFNRRNGDIADRSDLRLAVEVQSQLARRHQVVTNNVADGVFTLDEAGIVRSFNSSAEWIFGWVGEEIIGRHVSILLPDGGDETKDSLIKRYLKTGKAGVLGQDGSLLGQRKNGNRFPVELRLAEFPLGGSRFFAASARDLSKARAAEERRAAAERRTQISEMRFRDCATASSDYLWETDSEHRFTYWMGGTDLIGVFPPNVIGRTRWDVAEADPASEPWLQHLESLTARTSFKGFHFKMPTLDGKIRWFRSSGVPFFNEDGSFGGYRGATSDITDAVEAERQLQANADQQHYLAVLGQLALEGGDQEHLFSATIEVVRIALKVPAAALFEINADRTQLETVVACDGNREASEAIRCPLSEASLPTRAFFSETVIETDSEADANIGSGFWSGGSAGMAVGLGDITRRSGVLVVCDRNRVFDADERSFFQAVAVIVGASVERRRAEASLALRDRALESIGHGLVIADATKAGAPAVYVNTAFAQSRGRRPEELVASHLADLFSSRDGYEPAPGLWNELDIKGHFSSCLRRIPPGREEAWEDVSVKPLRNGSTPTHYVCLQTDVTSRVKMEVELRQAQKMDAVGKLTGGVAHDFNNLLTVILGNAELLAEELDNPQSKLTAELILEAAERGSDLVQRLLAFGRRQALQPEYVDLDRCVANVAALLSRTIGEDIVLRTELLSNGATSFVDKSHLETAILNLVSNARDAMESGGTLTLTTRIRDIGVEDKSLASRPGRYVSLTVADTGSGMPPEVKQRVFEPFFTTKQFGKGTGLGLSSVYGFVQQSSGHIHLTTELGRGTVIEILLPYAEGEADHEEATLQPAIFSGRERILVVEDQADLRDFVSSQLVSLGYDVVAASSAPDALNVLDSDSRVRLLFCDVLLPGGMNGFELAEEALARRPDLKLLFTSGYSDYAVERQSRLLESGIALLKKPYRRLELASAIRGALERGYVKERAAPNP